MWTKIKETYRATCKDIRETNDRIYRDTHSAFAPKDPQEEEEVDEVTPEDDPGAHGTLYARAGIIGLVLAFFGCR